MKLKLKDNPKLNLGDSYTRLEYIRRTGAVGPYIDTGIAIKNDYTFEVQFKPLARPSGEGVFIGQFGERSSGISRYSTGSYFLEFVQNYGRAYVAGNNMVGIGNYNSQYNTNEIATLNCNNTRIIHIEKSLTYNVNKNISDSEARNLRFGYTSDNIPYLDVDLYYIKIWDDNNELIRNLIPCLDTNSAVCMYDTITKEFFTNKGTGNFIAGPITEYVYPGISNNFKLNCSNLFHKDCPNINGWNLLNAIYGHQIEEEVENLHRIRLDIGNVSGTYAELIKFKDFGGFKDTLGTDFDDEDEYTSYPALYGTYTITDDMMQDDLDELEELFPGLTINCSGTVLDWNDIAVQTLDSTKPNYNPAVSIILNDNGVGVVQQGRGWYLTKTAAATITSIGNWFMDKVDVTDTNGIVSSDTTQTYPFESFDEFQYFSGVTWPNTQTRAHFNYCTKLEYITFPPTMTSLGYQDEYLRAGLFVGCTSLKLRDDTLSNIIYLYGCIRSHNGSLPTGDGGNFHNCTSITSLKLPATLQHIGGETFSFCTGLTEVKFGGSLDQWITLFSNAPTTSGVGFDSKNTKYGTNPVYYSHKLYVNNNQLVSGDITISTNNIYIYSIVGFDNVSKITFTGSFTTFPDYSICYCTDINEIVFPDTLLVFPADGLIGMPNNMIATIKNSIQTININNNNNYNFHITKETPPTLSGSSNKSFIVYVGDGSSQAHDNAILTAYSTATNWSTLYNAGRIKTWWEHENS